MNIDVIIIQKHLSSIDLINSISMIFGRTPMSNTSNSLNIMIFLWWVWWHEDITTPVQWALYFKCTWLYTNNTWSASWHVGVSLSSIFFSCLRELTCYLSWQMMLVGQRLINPCAAMLFLTFFQWFQAGIADATSSFKWRNIFIFLKNTHHPNNLSLRFFPDQDLRVTFLVLWSWNCWHNFQLKRILILKTCVCEPSSVRVSEPLETRVSGADVLTSWWIFYSVPYSWMSSGTLWEPGSDTPLTQLTLDVDPMLAQWCFSIADAGPALHRNWVHISFLFAAPYTAP